MPTPTPEARAGVVETHISLVFFVGDRAYKLKKHVAFGFVDLRQREARERLCRREVDLNRRLAPDVYIRVLDIVDASGVPIDHIVEMRRMPDDRRLASLVEAGADVDACVRALAHRLAAFHAAAPTTPEISRAGEPTSVRELWDSSLDEMCHFAAILGDERLDAVRRLAHRYINGRHRLLNGRVASGCIRDGHGDLLCDDIFCLDDGPRVLDCIEFDDGLRYGDVVADVAFLAMDLERLGAETIGARFLAWYREFSGEHYPASLADHYIAYRALVRSKVSCLRYEQGKSDAASSARVLLGIAHDHLERGRVRLVLVGGSPGAGKSTVAAGLADETKWTLLRSDETRKDLAGVDHASSAAAPFGQGVYSAEMTERTYATLLERAELLLGSGESVIIDATWSRQRHRALAAQIGRDTSSDLVELRCVLPAAEAAARVARRHVRGEDASDANAVVAAAMSEAFDPWSGATELLTQEPVGSVRRRAVALATS